MYILSNTQLQVEILDPKVETARLGSRYCTAGYIWQVTDARLGALMSGPEYPDEPSTFNGQGIPDMFRRPLGAETAQVGEEVSCIGVGRVLRSSPKQPFGAQDNPMVIQFLAWDVERQPAALVMRAEHTFGEWSYSIKRVVALEGRILRSHTLLRNQGRLPLSLYWFPHPFFPLTPDEVLCRFSIPVRAPENPGFVLREDGFFARKTSHDWKKGCFVALEYEPDGTGLTITQKHSLLGEVTSVTDYDPAFLPIWGNHRTFSFEPFIEREIPLGGVAQWSVEYQF
jgi:hypothetical protein